MNINFTGEFYKLHDKPNAGQQFSQRSLFLRDKKRRQA